MADDSGAFRFRVTAVFTLTGRGLVAAGVAESGTFPAKGDRVWVLHNGTTREVTCEGVGGMRVVPPADPATVGMLLPELGTDEVAAGDVIVASGSVPNTA